METRGSPGGLLPLGFFGAAALLIGPLPASAQTYDEQAAGVGQEDAGCVPACRAGFACRDGKCVSPCNPPCAGGEVCTRGGLCLPADPPTPPAASDGTRPGWNEHPVPASVANTRRDRMVLDNPDFDIDKARRRKAGGALLTTIGCLGFVGAGVLYTVSLVGGGGTMWIAATGIEVGSLLFFVPGVVVIVKNKILIGRYTQGISSRADLVPLAWKDGGGLALAVGF